jgi:hypothetical protein
MVDPVVHITAGVPDAGTGNITTLGQTIPPAGTTTASVLGGNLVQGAVTTAAPTYVNGQVDPLSLTTTGLLRVDGTGGTFPVTGTFWQTTQPVSLTSTTITGTVAVTQSTSPWVVSNGGTFAVQLTGATNNINNISGTISLPTGAATAAKQPALGTAGAASTDVITVQGIASGTVLPVSGTVAATQSGTWTVQQGTPPWLVGGDVANAATDGGNPVKIGGVAKTGNPVAVADGQRVNAVFDKQGKMITTSAIRQLKGVQKTSITTNTETTVVTAGAATVFQDVYAIIVTNKSATPVSVDFRDATAGTIRMTLAAPANDTRGFTVTVDSAMVQAVAANNWTATVSSAVTSIEITMLYVSNL